MNIIKTNFKYRRALIPLDLSKVRFIIVHHPEAVTATPEQIHEWHLARDNGTWAGFGYNEYIRKDGTVYIGRGDNVGSHCKDYNSVSYGICCEGNYDKETTMPQAQFDALVERLKYHSARFKNVQIKGHRDLNPTACPGKYFPLQVVINKSKEVMTVDWKDIIKKVLAQPQDWENAIQTAVNAAKADGDLGALEIFQFLPELIIKVYNAKGA